MSGERAQDTRADAREARLAWTFVRLADTLVTGFDVVDLLEDLVEGCVDLLGVSAAGLMLSDQHGRLRVTASSSETMRMLELLEVQNDEGPCWDAYHSAARVEAPDLADQTTNWPRFVAAAQAQGVGGAYALPLRLRSDTIGALNLFCNSGTVLPEQDLRVGQALADVATIALLNHRAISREMQLAEELQTALHSRIGIEQAKGVLAAHAGLDMGEAFVRLRHYARSTNQRLSDLAQAVAAGQMDPALVTAQPANRARE